MNQTGVTLRALGPPKITNDKGPENKFYRVANRSKILDFGGKKITSKAKNGSAQSMNFRRDDLPEEEQNRV